MDLASIFASDEVQKQIRAAANHLGPLVYSELYIYVWFICIYNVLMLFLILINLYVNIMLLRRDSPPDKYERRE